MWNAGVWIRIHKIWFIRIQVYWIQNLDLKVKNKIIKSINLRVALIYPFILYLRI